MKKTIRQKDKLRKDSSSKKKSVAKRKNSQGSIWQSVVQRVRSLFLRDEELAPWVIWGGTSLIALSYLLVVYFFFFHPYLLRNEARDLYFIRPYVHGVDVSHHQGTIDWPRLSRATHRDRPINFVFMKATEGGDFVDDNFLHNFSQARESGLVRGAYHFFLPDVPAEIQARNFISQVRLLPGDLPPVLDVEVIGKGGVEELQQRAATWLSIVERHYGVAPIIYASYKFKTSYLNNPPFTRYPYWIAHYYVEDLEYTGPWKFWQHTDRGRLDGINTRVDLNIFNGNLEELMQLAIK